MKLKIYRTTDIVYKILDKGTHMFFTHRTEEIEEDMFHTVFKCRIFGSQRYVSGSDATTSMVVIGKKDHTLIHVLGDYVDLNIIDIIAFIKERGVEFDILHPGWYQEYLKK